MGIIKRLFNSFIFWGAWIIIPVLMEIIPAIGSIITLFRRRKKVKTYGKLKMYPEITLIVPVYNSQDTLFACIESIYNSTYPNESIRVFLVNNKGQDDSFSVFDECQKKFPDLKMQWMNAEQGKSRALNLAIYNSEGKYIINVDSDGLLERTALTNLVGKFEANPDLNVMTGTILTKVDGIKQYKGFFSRLLRNLELMEYAQAFLAGRSYASENDMVYTLSGAFSAFRKSALLQSWMYNTDTVGEDTHMTFQLKYRMKQRVEICENAIFFVDPIESVNKLYTQRQRWQRGSLEVAHMFMGKDFRPTRAFKDVNVRTLLYDHTFAFPRMIWYLALICLMAMNYSASTVLLSTGIIFALYIIVGFFYFFSAASLLKMDDELRKYYIKHWWCIPLLPFFNLAVFFIRMAGVINSIYGNSSWRTKDLTDERHAFVSTLKEELLKPVTLLKRFRSFINKKPKNKAKDDAESKVQKKPKKEKKNIYSVAWYVCAGLITIVGALLIIAVYWSKKTFGIEINEIINTIFGPVEGTGDGMKSVIISGLVIPVLCVAAVCLVVAAVDIIIGRHLKKNGNQKKFKGRFYDGCHRFASGACAVIFMCGLFYGNAEYGLLGYYQKLGTDTKIYEDYYVSPNDVSIASNGKTKNLIYIYVESLETAYASTEDGGNQPVNYIPNLTKLANENLNFSDNSKLGGFHNLTGTNWTMAALFSTTSALPYATSIEDSVAEQNSDYMPGVVSLGDVLEEKGYAQEFLCGSDGSFAGRDKYFESHGGYNVFDIYDAKEKGYVDKDYWKNWGIEDKVLFDIAREELTELASGDKPFNFTLLTVDLHATDGYICDWCGDNYNGITPNVAACSDRLVSEFVDWCTKQDFYDDSVIVITGDHPRMDTSLVDGIDKYDRTVYNCFINSDLTPQLDIKTRSFGSVDIFPTVLASLGFEIEGDRLGLGTNLFSDKKTLIEEKGFDWVDQEFSKSSDYYFTEFAGNK